MTDSDLPALFNVVKQCLREPADPIPGENPVTVLDVLCEISHQLDVISATLTLMCDQQRKAKE